MRQARAAAVFLVVLAACAPAADEERTATVAEPIVGGVKDIFRSYVVGIGDKTGVFCTGTLISRRTVLTAGHCYEPSQAKGGITRVYFGNDLQSRRRSVGVVTAVRHPGYDDNSLANDLTLVHLDADAPSQPVPMLRETMTNGPDFVGPYFTFSGYGDDGFGNYDVRRVVVFPIAAVGPANVGLNTGTGPIGASEFYYDVADKNTCSGDSGGPGVRARNGVERSPGYLVRRQACTSTASTRARDAPAIAAFIQPTIDLSRGRSPCRADGVCGRGVQRQQPARRPRLRGETLRRRRDVRALVRRPVDPDCMGTGHCVSDGVYETGAACR